MSGWNYPRTKHCESRNKWEDERPIGGPLAGSGRPTFEVRMADLTFAALHCVHCRLWSQCWPPADVRGMGYWRWIGV